jgi:asparagine synthase (glutamine-hydrolysing)
MCGISGIINFNNQNVSPDSIQLMMQKMKRRGPDDEGLFVDQNIGLGFVRLSILDLSEAGHQPMHSQDDRYVIIFNGEIYNYIEIRNILQEKYTFKSDSDTEVILNSFIEWGEACVDHLNGMFAFVIYDKQTKNVFGARDRFGIKPFYYFLDENQFIFASDFPSILAVLPKQVSADETVIMNFLLTNRTNYSKNTFFNEIKRIEHGGVFRIEENKVLFFQWYDLEKKLNKSGFINPKEYYKEFKRSIEIQLRSDVPVGICLSGGLDSSAIASVILKEFNSDNLNSYSSVFEKGDIGDESEFIEIFEKDNIKMHFTKPTVDSLKKEMDEFIEMICEPVPDTSIYAEFKVMQLAKNYSTVILNGQGADEVLGGYDYFYGAYLKELLLKGKFFTFFSLIIKLMNFKKTKQNLYYLIFFLAPVKTKVKILLRRNNLISSNYIHKYKNTVDELIKDFYTFKTVNSFFIKHLKYKFEHHLIWSDKIGMHFSLETRFPFIDHNLIEKTINTNPSLILKDGWTKYILRESLENTLNDKIRLRKDKIGFETPEIKWFKDPEIVDYFRQIFNSESFNNRPFFQKGKILELLNQHVKGESNNAIQIWKAFHLELWYRKFIDKTPLYTEKKN